ncbi:hypothetical protein EG68_09958 [Paragonimus skrjabini miyazakii]|uniref:Uncharacterized protein n=1 Tax=Paragonimus skrjabini miyazakii TaxID=59628 RepID=A0A8S9YNF3_9TREM|nr:hypothetical protein EG68_09958 [Paragonimus skrjabini miyazakii]
MKRLCCLPGLSKSSLDRCLRRPAAEQDDPVTSSDIVTDGIPVAASADRGITEVDATRNLTIEVAGNDGSIPTTEIRGVPSILGSQSTDLTTGTMPGLRVRCCSGDSFTGCISDEILATYMHCTMSLTDLVYPGVPRRLLCMWENDIRRSIPVQLQNQLPDDLRTILEHVLADFAHAVRFDDGFEKLTDEAQHRCT